MTDGITDEDPDDEITEKVGPEDEADEEVGGLPAEILERLPEEARPGMQRMFTGMTAASYQGPMPHPVLRKLTSQHIDKILDGAEKDNERMYEDRRSGRIHALCIAGVAVVTFLAVSVIFLWADQGELLKGVLIGIVVFFGGLGAGSRFLPHGGGE